MKKKVGDITVVRDGNRIEFYDIGESKPDAIILLNGDGFEWDPSWLQLRKLEGEWKDYCRNLKVDDRIRYALIWHWHHMIAYPRPEDFGAYIVAIAHGRIKVYNLGTKNLKILREKLGITD